MRVTLFMSISVNGMIARPNGRGDFFTDVCWHGFAELAHEKGAVIWGRNTHELVSGWTSFSRDLVGKRTRGVVLTRNAAYPVQPSWEVASSPRAALEQLRERGIEQALVAGGTTVNTAFLREGLIDNVTLFVEAVIIGAGMPLVEPEPLDVSCRFIDMKRLTESVIRLDYTVVE